MSTKNKKTQVNVHGEESEVPMFDLGETQVPDPIAEEIHAEHCVIGSECNMTDGCRGKLRATPAINGQVQIHCTKCLKFAKGTRSFHGLTRGDGAKLFDRASAKPL